MDTSEKSIYSNYFGSVTDKRVMLNYKSGVEDIPVSQISSISFQRKRNYFIAVSSFVLAIVLIALLLLNSASGVEAIIYFVFIVFLLISGAANWLGHHVILISAAGKDRKPLKVEMSKTKEGLLFVEAVKKIIFK